MYFFFFEIVEARCKEAHHLVPDLRAQYEGNLPFRVPNSLLVDQSIVTECLKGVGLEAGKLQQGSGYSGTSLQPR